MLFFCFMACAILPAFAQTNDYADAPKKKVRISQAELYPYMNVQMEPAGTLEDFRRLAPGSILLNKDYSTFEQSRGQSIDADAEFSAAIGISFLDKKKNDYRNMKLRIGVNYLSYSSLTSNYSKATYTRYDTLSSSHGGSAAYLDSVRSESLNMRYASREIRADISLIFSTNPAARWALYGGIGATVGASIKSYTDVSYSDYFSIESTYEGAATTLGSNSSDNYNSVTERITSKNGIGYSVYIPMGIDYRMANKSEFWKRIHLFYEAKPFVNFSNAGELGTVSNVGVNNGVGLRVKF